MREVRFTLRLARHAATWFAANTAFAILVFFVIPLPLGLALRAFFDALAGDAPAGLNAWSAIALIVALQVGEAVAGPALGSPWSPLQLKAQALLQRNLIAGVLRGYGRHGLPLPTGEAISRFRDDPVEIADTLDALSDLIGRSCFAIGAAVVMWSINGTIAAAVLIPLLLTSFVAEALDRQISQWRAAARVASGRVTALLGETVAAHLAFRVAGTIGAAIDRLSLLGEERRRTAVRDRVLDQALNAINLNLVHLGTGLVLLIGAHLINLGIDGDRGFTIGDLALFVVYLDGLTWYPAEVGRVVADLKRMRVSLDRMGAMAPDMPPDALANTAANRAYAFASPVGTMAPRHEPFERLDVQDLTCRRGDGDRGVVGASFTVERGSFVVIAGRVGAGKSTLVRALIGLLPRDGGEIRWNGRPITDPASFCIPPRVAYTPQVPRLFSGSLRDNIELGEPADPSALARAIDAAVLERDIAALDRGVDTTVGPRGVKLSGGQVQRAAAARMFLRQADLYVLDDLSSALDAETEAELWRRLFARGRAVTCLAVSNRPLALERADQIVLMADGRIVDRGRLADLLLRSKEMRRLWQAGTAPSAP